MLSSLEKKRVLHLIFSILELKDALHVVKLLKVAYES